MAQGKQRRREREVRRQRDTRRRRARSAEQAQAYAAAQKNTTRRRRRRVQGTVLISIAVIMAVLHFFEHAGTVTLMSQRLEDLLIGFPTAGLLAFVGTLRLGTA